ncbi:MAG: hypothetical protein GX926_03280 [Candidatus Magasanikbacteria bacterium]|nr:hypothetical protein [Candidatus Magasanikbacteria bacterium]
MKKIVIFNVGGALSAYAEFDDKKVIIDIGSSSTFSPVEDFLVPLTEKKIFEKDNQGKFLVNQLFFSHLDRDHISDYPKFKEKFNAHYMTCPNDNEKQNDEFKVNRELLGEENDTRNAVLEEMKNRNPDSVDNPLISITDEISLFYILPQTCENDEDLKSGYANNISLVLFLHVGNKTLLLPGDMLKEGMQYLIDNNMNFKNYLSNDGVDYLIAPHHGLQTSFSEYLFQTMSGNKTRLNIISEKVREADSDENRSDVDSRYYSSDYSTGKNSLNQNAVKTSLGHIVIDFDTDETEIKQYSDIQDVIKEFI